MQRFDDDLAKAVSKDMSTYIGEVMSSISFRANTPGVNGTRTKHAFTRFGWCEVRHPYRIGNPEESDVFKAFGIERKIMYWRHHNAACVCAIIAKLRSAA